MWCAFFFFSGGEGLLTCGVLVVSLLTLNKNGTLRKARPKNEWAIFVNDGNVSAWKTCMRVTLPLSNAFKLEKTTRQAHQKLIMCSSTQAFGASTA